ncbi:MAG: RNA methyltransferase [Vicinamibacterales bacterium]
MQRITSRQNPIVAEYRAAARGDAGAPMLLDGAHLVSDAVAAGLTLQHVLVAADAPLTRPEIARILERVPATVSVADAHAQVMDAVSPVRSSSLIVALADRPASNTSVFTGSSPLVVVVCDVQDPGNLGAILRVAEGAGATGAIVAGQSADPFGWKALRGSMGSALRLPIRRSASVADAVRESRAHGARVVATVPRGGTALFDAPFTGPVSLLIGGEGPGLPPEVIEHADMRVTIPMDAPVESLNAAVAAAVLLYEARRQRTVAV